MNLLSQAITAPLALATTTPMRIMVAPRNLSVQANFIYGSGGTTVNAYLQTSFDDGLTWCDVAQFSFATASARAVFNLNSQTPDTTQVIPTDGALGANTAKDGLLGSQYRIKYQSTGTYAGGTSLAIDIQSDQVM